MQKTIVDGDFKTTTDYLSGFQYKDGMLQFFPHAEGYVNVENGKIFNYVYNYTDHLGNIRLSYAEKPGTSSLKIIEESNYYPFGLKHENYNAQKYDFKQNALGTFVVLAPTQSNDYKYKFQGQERQDDLGLNWDSFKWRNYDYAIGRFMSIDPLAEDYSRWTPYAFSGNIVINVREIEGLEPGVLFGTMDAAADNWGRQYNAESISSNREYASSIYTVTRRGKRKYVYNKPNISTTEDEGSIPPAPAGRREVGSVHSHSAYSVRHLSNIFSGIPKTGSNMSSTTYDLGVYNESKTFGYIVTPNGSLQKYNPFNGAIIILPKLMPYDRMDPTSPVITPLPSLTPNPIAPPPITPLPFVPIAPMPNPSPAPTPLPPSPMPVNPNIFPRPIKM